MLNDLSPYRAQTALAAVRAIRNLDNARPQERLFEYAEPFMGRATGGSVRLSEAFPVSFSWAFNDTVGLVCLSGVRTVAGGRELVSSWLADYDIDNRSAVTNAVYNWAASIYEVLSALPIPAGAQVFIAGHSLGGAIALPLARLYTAGRNPFFITVCTFGSPKVVEVEGYNFPNRATIARWSNPQDNVPSLPPLQPSAPLIYMGLTARQTVNAYRWGQPCQRTSVSSTGQITTGNDPPSLEIGASTILAALNSRIEGIFGTGHLLHTYEANLIAAIAAAAPAALPPPVVTIPGAPVAPATPPVRVPAPAPPPPTPVEIARSVVVAREAAVQRDAVAPVIGQRYKVLAIREGKQWYVSWLDARIAWAPTRKKAQALARHLNRFLRIYQGVGQSNSNLFVSTWAQYLKEAASPASDLKPTLNDGGTTPAAPGEGLTFFGIELPLVIVP